MSDAGAGEAPSTAHDVLGLAASATPDEVVRAYRKLRAHLELRASRASDPTLAAAREDELRALHRALLATPGIDASRVPPLGAALPGDLRARARLLLAWAVLASALAVGLGALLARGRAPADDGVLPARVVVAADPASAELRVTTGEDEQVVVSALADGAEHALAPGTYSLRATHPECPEQWQVALELAPGESRRYQPELCLGEGTLVVRSNVDDDRVRIDGVDVGTSGATPHPLRPGAHEVAVDKSGFAPWTATVRIRADETLVLNAELATSASAASSPSAASTAAAAAPTPPAAGAEGRAGSGSPAAGGGGAPADPAAASAAATAGGHVGAPGAGRPLPPRTGLGGSKSWHDAIKQDLVGQHDQNGSRTLDTPAEIDSIPCDTWRGIEKSYETGGLAVEMTHLYGFDGSEAPKNTLGVAPSVRDYAYEKMKGCGLRGRR